MGGLDERLVSRRAQESDCVEEVGLTNSVCPNDAREWPERHVDVHQVLEAANPEPGKHGDKR
jgi:hypothetical protein